MVEGQYHAQAVADVLAALETSPSGLGDSIVVERRVRFGLNAFAQPRSESSVVLFVRQFKSPLIALLVVAAVVSLTVGEIRDAIIIAAILLFNAAIGYSQESRAAEAMAALRTMTHPTCRVIRDGEEQELAVADVVPGDVLALAAGDIVPADARVIESANLKVSEAILTGEANPVNKRTEPVAADVAVPDRLSMVFRGTTVVSGRGLAAVTTIGMETEFGRIVGTVQALRREETPLQHRFAAFSRAVALAVVSFVVVFYVIGLLRGQDPGTMALVAITLAVAVLPEGLPIVLTLTLALGTRRMAQRKAIVRRLAAVETLGSVDVIAADKTGTLTYGEMMVREIQTLSRTYAVAGEGYQLVGGITHDGQPVSLVDEPLLQRALVVGVLCNDAHLRRDGSEFKAVGDPTEIALLVLAEKVGLKHAELDETHPRIGEFPFDFTARSMTTFHQHEGRELVAVKGAPEVILGLCREVADGDGVVPLTPARRQVLLAAAESLAERGLRSLALAYAEPTSSMRGQDQSALQGTLTFLGVVGIQDTVRPEAKQTIERCQAAGITVVMVTGDHRKTAISVSRELGLLPHGVDGAVIDGGELEAMDDATLAKRLPDIRVAARTSPLQKLRLVRAFRALGHTVAVTGDGVNDAPALIEADIGVAVDHRATDAAKEAADVLLTDGNLQTIVDAVEVGRGIFQNIRRVILYLFSTNLVEALVVFISLVAGLPLPFLPIQILWLNVVSDTFLDVAIATEPVHASVMAEPPRPRSEPLISRGIFLRLVGLAAVSITIVLTFIATISGHTSDLKRYVLGFTMLIVCQWFNAMNVRTIHTSVIGRAFVRNRWFLAALAVVLALHLTITNVPALRSVFSFGTLAGRDWLLIVAVGSSVLWIEEIRKWLSRHLVPRALR